MIRLQSSPSLLQVLLSVNAGPGKISIEKKRLFKKKNTSNPLSLSSIINLRCSNSPGVISWWSAAVYFLVYLLSPRPASPTPASAPHIPQNYSDHPREKGRELAPFNQTRERDAWIALKCYHSVAGKLRPSFKALKLTWRCNAFWSIFCYSGCINWALSLLFFSLCDCHQTELSALTRSPHSSRPDWILMMRWIHQMVLNFTEAGRNNQIWRHLVCLVSFSTEITKTLHQRLLGAKAISW